MIYHTPLIVTASGSVSRCVKIANIVEDVAIDYHRGLGSTQIPVSAKTANVDNGVVVDVEVGGFGVAGDDGGAVGSDNKIIVNKDVFGPGVIAAIGIGADPESLAMELAV